MEEEEDGEVMDMIIIDGAGDGQRDTARENRCWRRKTAKAGNKERDKEGSLQEEE